MGGVTRMHDRLRICQAVAKSVVCVIHFGSLPNNFQMTRCML